MFIRYSFPAIVMRFVVMAGLWLAALPVLTQPVIAQDQNLAGSRVEVSIFWEPGCPYCRDAKKFLDRLDPATHGWLEVKQYNVGASEKAQELFARANAHFTIDSPAIPLIIVGSRHIIGYNGDQTTGAEILALADACRKNPCLKLTELLEGKKTKSATVTGPDGAPLSRTINLPIAGEITIANWSLPALTILLAAVDGFNPCAMWVLVFLIGLLLGMQDRLRMWLLGGTFLLTSGVVYFLFLAAWLNVFLFLGAMSWIRIAVAAIALASGLYYLREFATNAAAECKVTNLEQRQRIMAAFKASVSEKRFLVAVGGVIVLAAAVNLIELLCSAGIPAVYTEVLALNNLSTWQHYSYLLLYITVFMIDDLAIFAIAMVTLQATGMTNRFLRISHLIGGVVMAAIGLMLIFAPNWLSFGF